MNSSRARGAEWMKDRKHWVSSIQRHQRGQMERRQKPVGAAAVPGSVRSRRMGLRKQSVVRMLALYACGSWIPLQHNRKPGLEVHTCNPTTKEVREREEVVQGH